MKHTLLATAVTLLVVSPIAFGHGETPHARKFSTAQLAEEKPFGKAGDPKKVMRTVKIDMTDTMRYSPSEITVKQGQTVRFEARNSGKIMHEIVLGTMQELREHAELMKKHPGMEHEEPYMAHVGPGKTERVVWQFTKPGEFYFGCLIPGHFEAGMVGKIIVK